jgi:DNA modification methylase
MTPHFSDDHLTVHIGDCRAVMASLPAESVHCVVTSPPYWGLRDYGEAGQLGLEPTPEEYVANMVEVFRGVRRVLRDDGTVWLNLGDSYAPDHAQKRNAGWKGEGPSGNSGIHSNVTGSRARDSRGAPVGLKPKDLIGIPWRVAFALQADGWYLRSDIIWAKPNPMPESVTDRPTKSHEYVFLLTKSARYYFDADAVREPGDYVGTGLTKAERVRNTPALASGISQSALHVTGPSSMLGNPAGRNIRSVWAIATQPYPGAHFATFPEKLVEPCVKAGCPPDGVVLDPFAGSGTVGRVANRLGRRAVLIDLSADYIDQAMLRNAQAPLGLGA